jgi:citryl-CoA lyase
MGRAVAILRPVSESFWRTGIGRVRPGEILVRGYALIELIGNRSFGDVAFLLLSGELPRGNEGRMMDALLVAAAEHSVVAPSVDAARFAASAGVPLQAAVAAGTVAMGEHHGGAVDAAARVLLDGDRTGLPDPEAAASVCRRISEEGSRLPGFGHVVHDPDPRASRLFVVAGDLGFRGRWCRLAEVFEAAAGEVFGRPLRMNVDGAMAALLLELGLDPGLGKAFYVIGRAPGLVWPTSSRSRPGSVPTGTWGGRALPTTARSVAPFPTESVAAIGRGRIGWPAHPNRQEGPR